MADRRTIMKLLDSADGQYTSEYSPEVEQAIYEAVHSGDSTLKERACVLVHNSLRGFEDKIIGHYGITHSSPDYQDFVQECFLTIFMEIGAWDPGKGRLSTFFDTRFRKTCTEARGNTGQLGTRYYENMNTDIRKAIDAFAKEGNNNPSPIELREYIRMHFNKKMSDKTITNVLEKLKDVSSIDVGKEVTYPAEYMDPVSLILQQENVREVRECIGTLEPQHRLLLEIELALMADGRFDGTGVPVKQIANEYRKHVPDATAEWVKHMKTAAERSFYRRYGARTGGRMTPVNAGKAVMHEVMQDEEDIRCAIEMDIDRIFAM